MSNQMERLKDRADAAAVEILEKIMRRQRWSAPVKDQLAEYLARFAMREGRKGRV